MFLKALHCRVKNYLGVVKGQPTRMQSPFWFRVCQTVDAGSFLFFLAWLGSCTPSQVGKVALQ